MSQEGAGGADVRPCGDAAVLVELGDLDAVLALAAALRAEPPAGVVDVVPAARTVLVRFDRDRTGPAAVRSAVGAAVGAAARRAPRVRRRDAGDGEPVEIPVVYDGADLELVGELTGLGARGVVEAHTGTVWTVAFSGFAPGFGYCTGGDPRLHVPRRETARTRIPAGTVALAGEFTGVYPTASPGGWQLVGRTGVRVWDLERDPPALLRPGAAVRFTEAAP